MPKKRLTAKQRVLRKCPNALRCFLGGAYDKWEIRAWGNYGHSGQLGYGPTPNAAWANAARRLHA